MKIYILIIFLFTSLFLVSQESMGLTMGIHNGINATKINPSFSLKSQYKWEGQLIGAHVFVSSNYGGVYNSNLFDVINNGDLIEIPDVPFDNIEEFNQRDIIFNIRNINTYLDFKTEVLGPGFLMSINDNAKAGFYTKARAYFTVDDIPPALNYYTVSDLPGDSIFAMRPFNANGAAWMEYGIHYAQQITSNISAGINVKYLSGYDAGVFDNDLTFDYEEVGDTLTSFENGQFRMAFTDFEDEQVNSNGIGIGFDLGVTFNNEFSGSSLGVSLLDIGYINFSGDNYLINYVPGQSIVYSDYDRVTDTDILIEQLLIDGFDVDSSANFNIMLPTALSLQLSQPINDDWNIEAQLVQNLKFSDQQIKRSNIISAAAVYDTKLFSAFIPMSLYDYSNFRIGAAIRFFYFTIGSDHLFSLFGKNESFNGSDIYFNLKFYPFKIKAKVNNGKNVECYGF